MVSKETAVGVNEWDNYRASKLPGRWEKLAKKGTERQRKRGERGSQRKNRSAQQHRRMQKVQ